ncbi:hypothetical protein PQE73_gp021 [Bacillus phage vB_BanS_MrDarsey]|nr:hypothetical protein PQE73_gp021 [Bacillus phage vB_BanS_MrDarsey]UGO47853.1 hypothetical protein MRDARSEY_21 [Bacillus phage vB_BanS_MrDarsey]
MEKQTQTLRLIDFHNRNISVLLKSGTVIPDIEVTDTQAIDMETREMLPSPLICGTDRWGNEHSIASDNIEELAFLDTDEQARLKNVTFLVDMYSKIPNLDDTPLLKESYEDSIRIKQELEAKGVTLYVPVREDV